MLHWLRRLLGEKAHDNPFSGWGAVRIETIKPDHLWLGQLESPGRLVMLVSRLFPDSEDNAEAPDFVLHTGDLTHLADPEQFDTVDQLMKGIKT